MKKNICVGVIILMLLTLGGCQSATKNLGGIHPTSNNYGKFITISISSPFLPSFKISIGP